MKIFIFLTTILSVSVSGYVDEWNLIHTSKPYNEILNCLNSYSELWDEFGNFIDIDAWKSFFLTNLLRDFQWHTLHMEHVNMTLTNMINDLVRRNELSRNRAGQVRVGIINALLNCTNDDMVDKQNEFVNQSNYYSVPNFRFQSQHLTDLLNFVLVDSESLLEQTNGLTLFLSFAGSALRVFNAAANERFSSPFDTLRILWEVLAESFFDFRNEVPYIRYTYSMESSSVYTPDNPYFFNIRARDDYNNRNMPAAPEVIYRVLNFHSGNRNNRNENVFHLPNNRQTITEADVYYEIRENRFFRVIFFFLELVDRGYADLDSHFLTDRPIPEDLLQLLHNDTYYGSYFEMVRRREVSLARSNGLVATKRYLLSAGQYYYIFESEVILLFYRRLQHFLTTTNVLISTTVSSVGASSTSESRDPNEDSQAFSPSEDFSKSQQRSDDKDDKNCNHYDPGPSCSKYFQNSQPIDKETSFKLLRDIFSTMLNSGINIQEEFACH